LCLTAAVSVHGMILAAALGFSALLRAPEKKRMAGYALVFIAVCGLLTAAARPAHDGTFVAGLNFSASHFVEVSAAAFATAFTSEWITSVALVALSIPLLWRGGGWWFFLMAAAGLCAIASLVYAQVWHHGVLFLAWLVALWISWPRGAQRTGRTAMTLAVTAMAAAIAVQSYWWIRSSAYDWQHAYSGSVEAAREIATRDLPSKRLFAVGFACVAIQPYFARNIFANWNEGRPEAYWDWSSRNHVNLDTLHLAELRPDYIVVGYKNEFERGVWTDLVKKSGYRHLRHFEGNSFWQARVLEPESYELYERGGKP